MHAKLHHPPHADRHESAIEALARQTHTEPAIVKQLFDRELAALQARAKVRGYLGVLASRRVRLALREAHAGGG